MNGTLSKIYKRDSQRTWCSSNQWRSDVAFGFTLANYTKPLLVLQPFHPEWEDTSFQPSKQDTQKKKTRCDDVERSRVEFHQVKIRRRNELLFDIHSKIYTIRYIILIHVYMHTCICKKNIYIDNCTYIYMHIIHKFWSTCEGDKLTKIQSIYLTYLHRSNKRKLGLSILDNRILGKEKKVRLSLSLCLFLSL